jgi:hypothetical protein
MISAEEKTYLTTDELSSRIKYDVRTIRERLKDSVLIEGIHYFRPFGGRKILYVWEHIRPDKPELRHWLRISPMSDKPYEAGVCKGFS